MTASFDNVYYPQGISYERRSAVRRRRMALNARVIAGLRRAGLKAGSLGEAGWLVVIKALEKASGYRRGLGSNDFQIAATTKELVTQKSRAVRDEVDTLLQTIMAKGAYVAKEDAARALHAVVSACQDRLSPEMTRRLRESVRQEEHTEQ
jgi:hypothetical protein